MRLQLHLFNQLNWIGISKAVFYVGADQTDCPHNCCYCVYGGGRQAGSCSPVQEVVAMRQLSDRGVRGFGSQMLSSSLRRYIEDAKELLRAIKEEGLTEFVGRPTSVQTTWT